MNTYRTNTLLQSVILPLWLALLGASLSLTIAIVNGLLALATLYLLVRHRDFIRKQIRLPYMQYILASSLLLQSIEFIHDGFIVSKAGKLLFIFALALITGRFIKSLKVPYFIYLFPAMVIGLIAGTLINQYVSPNYPLWATYSMTYANQAAGLAITIGLLGLSSKKWWIIVPSLAAMLLYTYMAGERAAILALAGALLALLLMLRKYHIVAVLAALTMITLALVPASTIQQHYERNVRFDIWQHGILIAQQDCFLGRGEKHQFNQAELDLYKSYAKGAGLSYLQRAMPKKPTEQYNMPYHNQYIQYLVEYGILGLAAFLAFLLIPVITAWLQRPSEFSSIVFSMIWVAFAIHCVFETAFDNHSAIVLGLLMGLMLHKR